jgi:hypothetical protein
MAERSADDEVATAGVASGRIADVRRNINTNVLHKRVEDTSKWWVRFYCERYIEQELRVGRRVVLMRILEEQSRLWTR